MPSPRPPPPRIGPYRLLRQVGAGGMAEVHEAIEDLLVHSEAGRRSRPPVRRVALKLLLPHLRDDPQVVNAFIDEARISAELDHPNVVRILDYGEADGLRYIAMEYLVGLDLSQLLEGMRERGRAMPISTAAKIAREVAVGLDYVHGRARRIVHRDVTPHNVFLTSDGRVKLSDFGVAKARARLCRTEAGYVKGKLPYLAPEQLRGQAVTPRTDIYALGLVLYEMASGKRANPGKGELELLEWAMNPRLPSLDPHGGGEVPPLQRVIDRAVACDPAQRTRDAAKFAGQLDTLLARTPCHARDLERLLACYIPKPSACACTMLFSVAEPTRANTPSHGAHATPRSGAGADDTARFIARPSHRTPSHMRGRLARRPRATLSPAVPEQPAAFAPTQLRDSPAPRPARATARVCALTEPQPVDSLEASTPAPDRRFWARPRRVEGRHRLWNVAWLVAVCSAALATSVLIALV